MYTKQRSISSRSSVASESALPQMVENVTSTTDLNGIDAVNPASGAPKAVSAAQPLWEEVEDTVTGDTYYLNTETGETQWDKPEDFGAQQISYNGKVLQPIKLGKPKSDGSSGCTSCCALKIIGAILLLGLVIHYCIMLVLTSRKSQTNAKGQLVVKFVVEIKLAFKTGEQLQAPVEVAKRELRRRLLGEDSHAEASRQLQDLCSQCLSRYDQGRLDLKTSIRNVLELWDELKEAYSDDLPTLRKHLKNVFPGFENELQTFRNREAVQVALGEDTELLEAFDAFIRELFPDLEVETGRNFPGAQALSRTNTTRPPPRNTTTSSGTSSAGPSTPSAGTSTPSTGAATPSAGTSTTKGNRTSAARISQTRPPKPRMRSQRLNLFGWKIKTKVLIWVLIGFVIFLILGFIMCFCSCCTKIFCCFAKCLCGCCCKGKRRS